MPHEVSDGIPDFLKIPQEERKAIWDAFRAARKILPPEVVTKPLPIGDLPDVGTRTSDT